MDRIMARIAGLLVFDLDPRDHYGRCPIFSELRDCGNDIYRQHGREGVQSAMAICHRNFTGKKDDVIRSAWAKLAVAPVL